MATPFALTNTTVVTGDRDGSTIADSTILVDAAGVIERVDAGEALPVPAGYRRIDAAGKYVAPGLINAHAHLFSDGKPLPSILTNEAMEGAVSAFFHSPFGKTMVKRRAKSNILTNCILV